METRGEQILWGVLSLAGGVGCILLGWVGSWGNSLGIIGVSPAGDFLIRFLGPFLFILLGLFLLLPSAVSRRT
jgi:hypothetical protein